jgi:TetR/AcrR family acrAB operon transcriptional repressor
VAAHAGVTRGAIYWHFRDKHDLLNAMIDRVVLPMQAMSDALIETSSTDPLRDLRDSTVRILRQTASDRRAQRVFDIVINKCELVDEMAVARESCIACRDRCIGTMERGFRTARRRGDLRPGVSARSAAIGLYALVEGLISSWLLAPTAFRLTRISADAVDSYLAGLRSPRVRRAKT